MSIFRMSYRTPCLLIGHYARQGVKKDTFQKNLRRFMIFISKKKKTEDTTLEKPWLRLPLLPPITEHPPKQVKSNTPDILNATLYVPFH